MLGFLGVLYPSPCHCKEHGPDLRHRRHPDRSQALHESKNRHRAIYRGVVAVGAGGPPLASAGRT